MGDNNGFLSNFYNAFGYFVKLWCIAEHIIVDAREIDNKLLNGSFGVYQANELINYFVTVKFVYSDFGDSFFVILATGGFYVKNCVQKNVLVIVSFSKYSAAHTYHCTSAL